VVLDVVDEVFTKLVASVHYPKVLVATQYGEENLADSMRPNYCAADIPLREPAGLARGAWNQSGVSQNNDVDVHDGPNAACRRDSHPQARS